VGNLARFVSVEFGVRVDGKDLLFTDFGGLPLLLGFIADKGGSCSVGCASTPSEPS
jgi:hypothetical protein